VCKIKHALNAEAGKYIGQDILIEKNAANVGKYSSYSTEMDT
jgi:hypothetical protein